MAVPPIRRSGTPPTTIANLRHNNVLHETTSLVSVDVLDVPRVGRRKQSHRTESDRAPYRCGCASASWTNLTYEAVAAMNLRDADFDKDEVTDSWAESRSRLARLPACEPAS